MPFWGALAAGALRVAGGAIRGAAGALRSPVAQAAVAGAAGGYLGAAAGAPAPAPTQLQPYITPVTAQTRAAVQRASGFRGGRRRRKGVPPRMWADAMIASKILGRSSIGMNIVGMKIAQRMG